MYVRVRAEYSYKLMMAVKFAGDTHMWPHETGRYTKGT